MKKDKFEWPVGDMKAISGECVELRTVKSIKVKKATPGQKTRPPNEFEVLEITHGDGSKSFPVPGTIFATIDEANVPEHRKIPRIGFMHAYNRDTGNLRRIHLFPTYELVFGPDWRFIEGVVSWLGVTLFVYFDIE